MYMYIALFRKKENDKKKVDGFDKNHNGVPCIREVGRYHEEQVINKLKSAISNFKGTWRIYKSVNERDFDKAYIKLQIDMIKGEVPPEKIDSKWKSILMSPKNKLGRGKWLIDIDDKDMLDTIMDYLEENDIEVIDCFDTPNGYGIITNPFDSREFNFPNVDIKKDALKFLERIEIE